jgi:hypothetical protein
MEGRRATLAKRTAARLKAESKPAAPKPRRASPTEVQVDLGERWSHVVLWEGGGVLLGPMSKPLSQTYIQNSYSAT